MRQQDCPNPECAKPIDVSKLRPGMQATCPHCEALFRCGDLPETGKGRTPPPFQPGSHSVPSNANLSGGSRLEVEGFENIEFLSKGAMGAVYRARESDLGRRVAIKVLSPELAGQKDVPATELRTAGGFLESLALGVSRQI